MHAEKIERERKKAKKEEREENVESTSGIKRGMRKRNLGGLWRRKREI